MKGGTHSNVSDMHSDMHNSVKTKTNQCGPPVVVKYSWLEAHEGFLTMFFIAHMKLTRILRAVNGMRPSM